MHSIVNNFAAKRSKKTKAERAIEGIMSDFRKMQEEADQKFREWEDERWKREMEVEERRRREDREHELLLMQMMVQCRAPPQPSLYPSFDFPTHHQTYHFSPPSSSPQQSPNT